MTTPDIEPAAGTGGAAFRRDLGPAKYELGRKLNVIVSVAKTWEDAAEYAAALFAPDAPAPSAAPERATGEGGLPTVGEMLWLVPLMDAFELACDAYASRERHQDAGADAAEEAGRVGSINDARAALRDAILARLAQPRPAAEGEGDAPTFSPHLEAAIGILRTAEHAAGTWHGGNEYEGDDEAAADADAEANAADRALRRAIQAELDAAPGRVDAGAVREAAQAVVDFVFSTPRHLRPSVPIPLELLATLETALAAAGGDGSAGETLASIAQWCEDTFGPISPESIVSRAAEEMDELRAEPTKVEEAADVVIVLSRYPGLWDAVQRKMVVNRAREWRLMGDGTGYHVKDAPPAAPTEARS